MLAKIVHEVTKISDDEAINLENYMEGIGYVDKIYTFINKIKLVIPTSDIKFRPSFKGCITCEKFNIESRQEENEMRYFITDSAKFLEDKETKKEQIRDLMGPLCESIEFDGETIRFILK